MLPSPPGSGLSFTKRSSLNGVGDGVRLYTTECKIWNLGDEALLNSIPTLGILPTAAGLRPCPMPGLSSFHLSGRSPRVVPSVWAPPVTLHSQYCCVVFLGTPTVRVPQSPPHLSVAGLLPRAGSKEARSPGAEVGSLGEELPSGAQAQEAERKGGTVGAMKGCVSRVPALGQVDC